MIICGDALTELRKLPDESANMCVTSPPYWGLRDYGVTGQLGLEKTPEEYVARMVEVFREVRRALKKDGTLWLNLGDCYHSGDRGGYHRARAGVKKNMGHSGNYNDFVGAPNRRRQAGLKDKDLVGIPWAVAFALRADGWYLRRDIIWNKSNPMPESVADRPSSAHEYIFLFSKDARYYYDSESIREIAAEASSRRWAQDVPAQIGSNRIPGKTNGPMRAVGGPYVHGNKPGRDDGGRSCNKAGQEFRNSRSVWTIATTFYQEASGHFATFPPEIPERCIKAGCPKGGTVLDPFFGAGTTGFVALRLGREFIGIDLSPAYCEIARKRIYGTLMEAHP